MKKKKQKAVVKEQKKVAKKELKDQLVGALSTAIPTFGSDKKIQKIVAKSAKQLAEKLAALLTMAPVADTTDNEVSVETEAATPVKEKKAAKGSTKKTETTV